jgi:hypothetical protein
MSWFVVFDWKNLQNERLYTLIPVHISSCTLTTKVCPFSDLHITLRMEQVHYCWAAKKYLFLATTNSVSHHNQLTAASKPPPYSKVELRNEGQFQTASHVSETLEFDALCESRFLGYSFEQATQGSYFNLKETLFFLRCEVGQRKSYIS